MTILRVSTIKIAINSLILLQRSPSVNSQAQEDGDVVSVVSTICDASTCRDCVAKGCGWVPYGSSSCLTDCSFLADAPCYSDSTVTAIEGVPPADRVCGFVEQLLAEQAFCRGFSIVDDGDDDDDTNANDTGCTACVSVMTRDNGDAVACAWDENNQVCTRDGSCGLLGCPSRICADRANAILPTVVEVDNANNVTALPSLSSCANATTCLECVQSDCSWTANRCYDSCVIADSSCFNTNSFDAMTPTEICDVEEKARLDFEICTVPQSCSDCVATNKTEGTSTCQWYSDTSICGKGGCGMNGICGSTNCTVSNVLPTKLSSNATIEACADAQNCLDCLTDPDCAWNGGECFDSCVIADAPCYSSEFFPNVSASDICALDTAEMLDTRLCEFPKSCEACVSQIKTDQENACVWYSESGTCGTGGASFSERLVGECSESVTNTTEDMDSHATDEMDPLDTTTDTTDTNTTGTGNSLNTTAANDTSINSVATSSSLRVFMPIKTLSVLNYCSIVLMTLL